jgi:hypothetical protein
MRARRGGGCRRAKNVREHAARCEQLLVPPPPPDDLFGEKNEAVTPPPHLDAHGHVAGHGGEEGDDGLAEGCEGGAVADEGLPIRLFARNPPPPYSDGALRGIVREGGDPANGQQPRVEIAQEFVGGSAPVGADGECAGELGGGGGLGRN